MNLSTLLNIVNHPDVIPEYMQQHGKTYANPGHENEVNWIYYKVDGEDFFIAFGPGKRALLKTGPHMVAYNEKISKRLVVEIKDV